MSRRAGTMPHDAWIDPRSGTAWRCRDSMRRFERFRSRLSIAAATLAAAVAMAVFICRTAHLLD